MLTALILALVSLVLPACPTEDSPGCYWDASRGNGTGTSFVAVDEDHIIYLPRF